LTNANTPLAGLKVVELARVLAGPWTGQVLADLGADVIKVESPGGDDTRKWGPPWIERPDGLRESAYYHACNRGKRGVVADFKDPADLARVKALCADADVVIENFKVGNLARFGLDYASLIPANPKLVYCSITGFGQEGPYAHSPGYDFVVQGMSGFMSLTGEPNGEPMKFGVSISDLACGLYAAIAIQAALLMRARTGAGQHIDMALLDCSVGLLANQALSYLASGRNPPRMGNAHAQVVPYQVYALADGHFILATGNDEQFRKLARLLGRDDLADDPRLQTNAGRIEHREWMNGEIARELARFTKAEIHAACEAAGVPTGPINTLDEVFADPQVRARGMRIELPDGIPSVRSPFAFSRAELALDRASPRQGEHQDLLERGFD
jgi:crotonobetainyl-CoA:carnitine CoA-transferase CaiB-like acyl-CoA transferase